MKKAFLLYMLIFSFFFLDVCLSQSIEEIKMNREVYLWGEGVGKTIEAADNQALKYLISQISVSVQSSFEHRMEEMVNEDGDATIASTVESVINTYSDATLLNTERIIIEDEPNAQILRYIKREQIHKVFESRKNKLLEFCDFARKQEIEHNPAEALRYYYWSYALLLSHPNANTIYYTGENGEKHLLLSWLPTSLRRVFNNIHITVKEINHKKKYAIVKLNIYHQNIPVEHFDYMYWDGRDWSSIISAKNGLGVAELPLINNELSDELRIKGEYMYRMEAHMDKELDRVLKNISPLYLKERQLKVDLKSKTFMNVKEDDASNKLPQASMQHSSIKNHTGVATANAKRPKMNNASFDVKRELNPQKESISTYTPIIKPVIDAISSKNYESVKDRFTKEGYETYQKLICYGNAEVLDPTLKTAYTYQHKKYVRSVPMLFSFQNNSKQFVENVVFSLNDENLIDGISFALSEQAYNDIEKKEVWELHQRMAIITFLENYKTAYALERLDYIESIFEDNALIIVGNIVKKANDVENQFGKNELVQYNRYSKDQYISRLRGCFMANEYINLKFEDSHIVRGGGKKPIFGLQIKQSYYSSNYGDVGYLFLLVDLEDPNRPLIHVRTWQPNIEYNKDGSRHIYGLGDF